MSDLNFSLASGVKPMIREAASMHNDGGGGNLGYMQQGKKNKDKDQRRQYLDESIFGQKKDELSKEKDLQLVVEEGSVSNFLVGLAEKFLKFLEK
ncbi:hypothetical protein IKP85_07610 [bacterium]|nr:hypothetical protein [bacterium]